MRLRTKWAANLFLMTLSAVIPPVLLGCSVTEAQVVSKAEVVKPGDRADVGFTCRLSNGEIAVSSYKEVAKDPSLPKSRIFLPRDRSNPLEITAGQIPEELRNAPEKGFEGEVWSQISKAIIGLPFGEKRSVGISAERLPDRQKGEHFLKMARVRPRAKEMRFTPEEYKAKTGNDPQVGRPFMIDPAIPGKIESVSEKEVIVRFSPPNKEVDTPLGKGTVTELPDKYEIVIDARPGSLVRSGGFIGRIVDVNDREITIDYGHPFGGESLLCDVLVESVKPLAN